MNMSFSENAQKLVRFSLKLFSSATQGGFFYYFFSIHALLKLAKCQNRYFMGMLMSLR